MEEIVKKLESLWKIETPDEFEDVGVRLLCKTYENFRKGIGVVQDLIFEANVVLDRTWEMLNVGKWVDVPIERKQMYAIASYIKVVALLHENQPGCIQKCLEVTDLGILLGYPINSLSLTEVADLLSSKIQTSTGEKRAASSSSDPPPKKLKLENELETVSCPSLEFFRERYLTKQKPVKLTNCIDFWPALEKWKDLGYIVQKAGHRTVPVELGKHYADKTYSQKLMKVSEFVVKYFGDDGKEIGYLAQHQLFDQVPELKKDIIVPDYCAVTENPDSSCQTEINAWFGPKGTVSPLHFDPKNNLLCQVVGVKKVILYSQDDSKYLYPHEGSLLFNTSRVDVENPDLDVFPEFQKATKQDCVLGPGDVLFIPPKYWHHVRALENSFSVSFWWD